MGAAKSKPPRGAKAKGAKPAKGKDVVLQSKAAASGTEAESQGLDQRKSGSDPNRTDKEALLNQGETKLGYMSRLDSKPWWGLLLLTFMPWLMFVCIALLFCFCYHHACPLVWASVLILAVCSGLTILADSRRGRPRPRIFLGVLCLTAVLLAAVMGFFVYHYLFATVWVVEENRMYTNLMPAEPSVSHADAGIIRFAKAAIVDTTKAASFQAGVKWCVAPIVRQGLDIDPVVQYWAAGVDCCSPKNGFLCDDVLEKDARGGIAIVDASPWLGKSARPNLKLAVDQAAGWYGLLSADEPVFVRWLKDPLDVHSDEWKHAIVVVLIFIAAYFGISLVLAVALFLGSRRKPLNSEAQEEKRPLEAWSEETSGRAVPGAFRQDPHADRIASDRFV